MNSVDAVDSDKSCSSPNILQFTIRDTNVEMKEYIKDILIDYQEIRLGDIVLMDKALEVAGEFTKLQHKYRGTLLFSRILPSGTRRLTYVELG